MLQSVLLALVPANYYDINLIPCFHKGYFSIFWRVHTSYNFFYNNMRPVIILLMYLWLLMLDQMSQKKEFTLPVKYDRLSKSSVWISALVMDLLSLGFDYAIDVVSEDTPYSLNIMFALLLVRCILLELHSNSDVCFSVFIQFCSLFSPSLLNYVHFCTSV